MDRASEIRTFIFENVDKHPKDIVAVASAHFGVTRTSIHRHLSYLIANKVIYKTGTTNSTNYARQTSFNKVLKYKISKTLSESDIWANNFEELKDMLLENVYGICQYGFTEMVNNAIDHSKGENVIIETHIDGDKFSITIKDDGIGIFRKLKEALKVDDVRESVLHLSKGKFTTDPDNHSGEGIFFSSRAFDSFCILSNGYIYLRDNKENDWFLEKRAETDKISTMFKMEININSKRDLQKDVFEKYVDPETQAFNKTHILVNLSLANEDRFVSRSQAKRIVTGLEKFKHIVLDFKGISAVGQAFVDEVFRVFKNSRPSVEIEIINANSEIQFMVQRGIATANENQI